MMVKAAPRLATILCRWLGRWAMPTGLAVSATLEAMATVMMGGGVEIATRMLWWC